MHETPIGPFSGQHFFYREVGQPSAERSDSTRDYVWLGGLPVAVIDPTQGHSTLRAIHADHLGTPRVITDGEGKPFWSWSPHDDPFGENALTSTNGYVFHLRFAGQYHDQETGLHYNLQRYYGPTVGRYLTGDPTGLSAGINTYAYASGSPLIYFDFLGLCAGGANLPSLIIRSEPHVTLKVELIRPPITRLKPSSPLLTKVDVIVHVRSE